MDKSLGDLLDHMEELGIAEDTLILFLGDNGSDAPLGNQHEVACAAPLRGKKGAHYEGGMRVPFIAAWAKPNPNNKFQRQLPIPANAVQSQVANVTDIFPTVLALTETPQAPNHIVDGSSLQVLMQGEQDDRRSETFLMHYPHGPHRSNYFTTWRNGDWKVIYHAIPGDKAKGGNSQSGGKHYQLFNLRTDPFESADLAEKEPQKLRAMMAELVEQLKEHEAVYPVNADGERLEPVVPAA